MFGVFPIIPPDIVTAGPRDTPGAVLDASLERMQRDSRTLAQRVDELERENERLRSILRREGFYP